MLSIFLSIVFSVASFSVPSALAYTPNAKMPACLDGPDELKVDNERILKYKTTTHNQFLARGFGQGLVVDAPSMENGHLHFVISIGPGPTDTLEVIYNIEFGSMPNVNVGDHVTVCGDYITSTAQSGSYPPSPEGAIIHWVHFNPGTRAGSATHAHGFIMIENNLIGFDDAPSGDWDGRIIKTQQPNGPTSSPDSQPTIDNNRRGNTSRGNNSRRNVSRPLPLPRGPGGTLNPSPNRYPNRFPNRPNPGQGNRRPPPLGGWQPCRTLQECSARNGSR